jgi:small-conductance mechanosensitive channel
MIIAAIFVYRTARDNGYNAILWTFIAVVVFLGVQFLIGILFGVIVLIGNTAWGWPTSTIQDYSFIMGLLATVPAIGAVLLILRHVNTIKDDEPANPPPPPPTFDKNI